jgi:hypothetical protein
MANAYGVSAADIAAELPSLFSVGFTQATKPTAATVEAWITDADTFIDTVVAAVTAVVPEYTETASRLAKRYILDEVVVRVYRAVYAGKAAPADIAALVKDLGGATILKQIQELPALAASLTAAATEALEASQPAVAVPYITAPRDLLIDDTDLDPHSGFRGRF